jgi:hypothetical protein
MQVKTMSYQLNFEKKLDFEKSFYLILLKIVFLNQQAIFKQIHFIIQN